MVATDHNAPVSIMEASEPHAAVAPTTAPPSEPKPLIFRAPSTSPSYQSTTNSDASTWTSPPLTFLTGPWHVTHSTLPMWKSNKNVVITYTVLPDSACIDDLVTYNPVSSPHKQKTVRGVDTPDPNVPAAYNWRGRGWLKIASSHWEVLGWGEEEDGWVVTFFAKTLFTPAGVDVYARRKGGLSRELVERVKREMARVAEGDEAVRKLVGEVFEIQHDW